MGRAGTNTKQSLRERIEELENTVQSLYLILGIVNLFVTSETEITSDGKKFMADIVAEPLEKAKSVAEPIINTYCIIDDCIDEAGHEGFNVIFGNPYTAIGYVQATFRTLKAAKLYVKKHDDGSHTVYRVRLARRHKNHGVSKIKL